MGKSLDVRREMERIRQEHESAVSTYTQQQARVQAIQRDTRAQLENTLSWCARQWAAADPHLQVGPSPDANPGFIIRFRDSVQPPEFIVSTNCQGEHVQVIVKDGHWRQTPNVFDKFADWMDQREVFNGKFDAQQVEAALAETYLSWYQEALRLRDGMKP
ncbi:hypothetical protein [Alicyclobacillus shizuokensis]|uniref:hypothetical protein n=1 Tax=Alicyclobacillus shizuokensis TaxID=392014 RepID=UPI000834906C|nr:hypothetical protein [Alicyclobacillus shizuokensis]MCL6625174.1 hypothetical protein [Alicyclobacillus shizuokensis]